LSSLKVIFTSEVLTSSRMFGGKPISGPITGPSGADAFARPTGIAIFGGFLPSASAVAL